MGDFEVLELNNLNKIRFTFVQDEVNTSDAIVLSSKKMTSTRPEIYEPEFARILEATGRPMVQLTKRTPPDPKAIRGNDFFLSALRYRELIGCPNPSNADLKEFSPIVMQESWQFYRNHKKTCSLGGFDSDDAHTFAQLWLVIYLHRYQCSVETHRNGGDRARLLRYFIRQRFCHLLKCLNRHIKNFSSHEFGDEVDREESAALSERIDRISGRIGTDSLQSHLDAHVKTKGQQVVAKRILRIKKGG